MIKSEELNNDSESDTESVCSTVSASGSVTSSNEKVKVRATFPPFIATKQLYVHFANNGFDESEVHIQRHTDRKTGKLCGSATVIIASQPGMFISLLNDTLILNLHKLKVEPYVRRRRQGQKQKHASKQWLCTTPPTLPSVDTTLADLPHSTRTAPDPCRIFVGSGLPTYINEQHIHEHFHDFAHEIIRVDTIRDKITQIPKGYFFITFKSQASADMAIQKFHKSFILGEHRLKVERQKSAQPQYSKLVEAPRSADTDLCLARQGTSLVVDNLNPAITDDEINALTGIPIAAVINDESNPHRRYIQFHSHSDAVTAKDKLNGKTLLGQIVQAAIQEETHPPNVAFQYDYHHSNLQQPVPQHPFAAIPQAYDLHQHSHTFTPGHQLQQRR